MLFGEYETVEEFLAFLCKACFASFSFAHRIVWFLKSLMNPENPYNEKIRSILHLIQTIFKSETKKHLIERLHVAGSKKFIDFLHQSKLFPVYEYYLCGGRVNLKDLLEGSNSNDIEEANKKVDLMKQMREQLDAFIDFQYSNLVNMNPSSSLFQPPELKLDSEYIMMNIFRRYDAVTNDENNILTQYVKQIDMEDINLSSFLSNINFVDHLCNICEILRHMQATEQNKTLVNELRKVNKILPANVYLPFLKDSIRNYVIAHIPLSEVKIFKTKNRAPYMVVLECFRLDELTFNMMSNVRPRSNSEDKSVSSNSEEDDALQGNEGQTGLGNENKKKKSQTPKSKRIRGDSKDDFGMPRNGSYVDSLLNRSENIDKLNMKGNNDKNDTNDNIVLLSNSNSNSTSKSIIALEDSNTNIKFPSANEVKQTIIPITNTSQTNRTEKLNDTLKTDFYTRIRDKKIKSFIEPQGKKSFNSIDNLNAEKRFSHNSKLSKSNYLLESDVNLSKPVVIKNILAQNTSEAQNAIKKRRRKDPMSLQYEDLEYETDPEEYKKIDKVVEKVKKEEYLLENPLDNTSNIENSVDNSNILERERDSEIYIKHDNNNVVTTDNKHKHNDNNSSENSENENEAHPHSHEDEHNDEIVLNTKSTNKSISHDLFFGEKIEEQTERLKKLSPFGLLNTYKLMKIIIKSGEDLRQEQFATQLINEFYQIFRMEKVDCWVNPYEILATGNNVGIIEVVPNAVSIDQLKRKSKQITSLRNFYEIYFGPVNSERYKKGMKNFISSLAGYSLVCYFLQIKDRHNANIMIDDKGHIIHIDFGFMLSNAPGKGLQFEKAPFKLTKEFVDVMGGANSKYFSKFRKLLWK